jgi:indolepyruvate ferredoxin oxidoreductase beta subunit
VTEAARTYFRLLLVGVGGQGCVTAARVLGDASVASGHPARIGELHGMSQRGGSVEASVVVGPGSSGMIGPGQADVVLGFEPLETWRALGRMSGTTRVLMNSGRIVPATLTHQGRAYPEVDEVLALIRAVTRHVVVIDGSRIAREAGFPRATNVVMLGALAGLEDLPLDIDKLRQAVLARSPPRFVEDNRKAYELGVEAIETKRAEADEPAPRK